MAATDITPRLGGRRQLIESYGGGGFKISGSRYTGSVFILADGVVPWAATSADELTAAAFAGVLDAAAPLDVPLQILVIGCGRLFAPPPPSLIAELRAAGIAAEWMDTGAACRTYNVLLFDGRGVAAALIAVD